MLKNFIITISASTNPDTNVRLPCFNALNQVPLLVQKQLQQSDFVATQLWIARHDTVAENQTVAENLWTLYQHPLPTDYFPLFENHLASSNADIQAIVAKAIAGAMKQYPDTVKSSLAKLFAL